jgi:PAS domain S-box-containing protein
MTHADKINVLLVDDQPAKLLAYEVILKELDENLLKASSAREALEHLLKNDVAILLVDVCMPDLDGFQLASMIRQHPRFQQTAIIFVSAVHLADVDLLRGYEMGAVDYVSVPVIPEVLRAKVKVFAELYRKTRQLEQFNRDLEERVADRTRELEAANAQLIESEQAKSLALAAGQMGSWDWNPATGDCTWDDGQYRIFGVDRDSFDLTFETVRRLIHPEDIERIRTMVSDGQQTFQTEARIIRPNGQTRWCICAAAKTFDPEGPVKRVSGVTIDITDLKEAEDRRTLLVREIDHRARNVLALVQSIIRLTKSKSINAYVSTIEGRIRALSTAHALLSESRWEGADLGEEDLAPYQQGDIDRLVFSGPTVFLQPESAQSIALVLHELATNAVKYGSLSQPSGHVEVRWRLVENELALVWEEIGGPSVQPPASKGYGMKVIHAGVLRQLDGALNLDWRPGGLFCEISFPVGRRKAKAKSSQSGRRVSAPRTPKPVAGGRLLLVEDEALVGMMMSDILVDLGFSIIGPFTRISDAMKVLGKETFQAAILDINVRGDMVYDLADAVLARNIPIVFVTGYSSEAIEERFKTIPVLQKPVDRSALER